MGLQLEDAGMEWASSCFKQLLTSERRQSLRRQAEDRLYCPYQERNRMPGVEASFHTDTRHRQSVRERLPIILQLQSVYRLLHCMLRMSNYLGILQL